MIKVIIAGSRTFDNYDLLFEKCSEALKDYDSVEIEIVSGNARGADRLGERFAKEKGFALTLFPADWNKFGKSAGYIRNKEMAEYMKVTREDIQRVAQKYFTQDSRVILHYLPKEK